VKYRPTASQTVGPFSRLGFAWLAKKDLAAPESAGEWISISGAVYDGDRRPVNDAVLELWQADAHGEYAAAPDPQALGFGRVMTDGQGRFRFATVKPGPVPQGADGNAQEAPHIHVALFARGMIRHRFTRIYFSDETANDTDPTLTLDIIGARRQTLIAKRRRSGAAYRWDIVLQGEGETVFFDF